MNKFGSFYFVMLALTTLIFFIACEEDGENEGDNLAPERFTIDVPDAISYSGSGARIAEDEINGGVVYALLGVYVNFGEESAKLVEEFIVFLGTHPGLTRLNEFSFTSDEDGRIKNALVEENGEYNGTDFQYKLTIRDEDESMAFQLFWNRDPISGIAIMSPYNIDRTNSHVNPELIYMIEYTEDDPVYEKVMIVSVSDHEPIDTDGIDNFKMYAGKNGNVVEIYGNSNHPTITIIGNNFNGARNYAFVGRADENDAIGVAKVALPPSTVETNMGLFEDYSIRKVLEYEVEKAFGISLPAFLEPFLVNSDPPGYFVKGKGFEGSGDNIPDEEGFTVEFINLDELTPYIPKDIRDLNVAFSE